MLLVDTADKHEILEALKTSCVRGFTTNPALVAIAAGQESLPLPQYVASAVELCGLPDKWALKNCKDLMIQAVGGPSEVLRQANIYMEYMAPAGDCQLWIKLAPDRESIACCESLKKAGCKTMITAVFTATQAMVAMAGGADGVAVYLGRLMRLEPDWERQIERIAGVVREAGRTLLLASFPNRDAVERALDYSHDLTVPPKVLVELLDSQHSNEAMRVFGSKVSNSDL